MATSIAGAGIHRHTDDPAIWLSETGRDDLNRSDLQKDDQMKWISIFILVLMLCGCMADQKR
jgi:hypothetical protein